MPTATVRITTIASERGLDYIQFRPPAGQELLYRAWSTTSGACSRWTIDGTHVRTIVPPTVPSEMDVTFANAAYSADGSRIFFNMYTTDASFGEPAAASFSW